MKKLKLEDLAVESFAITRDHPGGPGTVRARESDEAVTKPPQCGGDPRSWWASCYVEYGCMNSGETGAVCCPTLEACG